MKKFLSFLFFILLGLSSVQAQDFQDGLTLYEQGDYERALRILENSSEPEALLFAGKSHFALSNYLMALSYLNKVDNTAPLDINHDARYTAALAYFQLDNFSEALDLLKELGFSNPSTTPSSRAAIVLYDQILGYLTPKQRFDVFRHVDNDEIRMDLLESSIGSVKYTTAVTLVDLFKRSVSDYNINRLNAIETQLSDSVSYSESYRQNQYLTSPKGLAYNIGVALPEFDFESSEYEIAQHIYLGIQLAVEEFNSSNPDQKAFIYYKKTNGDDDAESIISDLVWNKDVDMIIGPLFSQVAKEFSGLAEDYQIPMLLPLANADSLDLYNDYVFQMNPTFASQGKKMARHAFSLGYDTLGVIAEARSLGAPAARSFLHEFERLGGFIEYYFEEKLDDIGYDITDYTKFFTTDTLDSVAMVQGVYAPFTGTIAPTLIESMLTDLEAMRSTVDIFGSEEWAGVDLDSRRLNQTNLSYTESFSVDTSTTEASEFTSAFRLRFETIPNQFAYIGYDAAEIVLQTLQRVKNPAYFRDALKNVNNFRGLSMDVSFQKTHVNQDVVIQRLQRYTEEEIIEEQ